MTLVEVVIRYEEFWDSGDCEQCGGGGSSEGYIIDIGNKQFMDFAADTEPGCFGGPHYSLKEVFTFINSYLKGNDLVISEIIYE